MFRKRWLVLTAGYLALAATVGCSKGGNANNATASGVVTHNGVPVDQAKVTFHSTAQVEGKAGSVATIQTDSTGKYLIPAPGIPAGMYKVTVTKLDAKGPVDPAVSDPGQLEASGQAKNKMPKDYENPVSTKLSVTLEPGKNENKNLELKGTASNTVPDKTP